jgi:cytochrome P450
LAGSLTDVEFITDLSPGSFPSLSLKRHPERVLDRWARRYGPIYSMRLGTQLFVVLSDATVARDLLVAKSAVSSDRKQTFVKSQTVLAGRGITASSYGKLW